MSLAGETELSDETSRAVAGAVREELARRRISRQTLADLARISISTLEKALAGRRAFTLATTIRLEEALGMKLPRGGAAATAARPAAEGVAPEELGSYARAAVKWIEGSYLTLRPSFGDPSAIYAYRTEIGWSADIPALTFREGERLDTAFTQFGSVALPNQSGHVYLVTSRHGQYRLVMLSRPTIGGVMNGILTTLQAGRGSLLMPVSAPIALVPIAEGGAAGLSFGRIMPADAAFAGYRAHLDRVMDDGFAAFYGGPGRS